MTLGSDVADLQHHFAVELLLDVEVEVLHVRRLDVAIEAEGVAFIGAASILRTVHGLARDDGSAIGARGDDRVWSDVVVSGSGIEEWCVGQVAEHHVLRESVEEHAPSSADDSLAFAGRIPGSAQARGKVGVDRIVEAAQSGLSDLGESEGSGAWVGRNAGDVAEQVVLLADDAEVVVAEAVVEGEARGGSEAVLNVKAKTIFKGVTSRVASVLEAVGDIAVQEVLQTRDDLGATARQLLRRVFETKAPAEVLIEVLLDGGAVKVETEFHIVLVELPGEVIDDLVVAVDAMARDAGSGTQLSKVRSSGRDQDDRQARIKRTGAIA